MRCSSFGSALTMGVFLLAAHVSMPSRVVAQAAPRASSDIDTIVVTERALNEEIDLVPGGVTLVDADELKQRNTSSLADLLRYVPGVWSASAYGGDSIFFSSRGSNLDATDYDMNGIVLLQDGLPVTTADGNNHNRILDPLSARYATVARGANALEYGVSTLGGSIAFASPTARNSDPLQLFVNAGSFGQLLARGTLGAQFSDNTDGLLTIEGKQWDGYRDHSEERRAGLYGNFGWRPSERTESRFFVTYVDNDEQLPGALTRAQFDVDPNQAAPDALTGNYQKNVDTLRVANHTIMQVGENGRLEFGVSFEQQSLYHPIVDVRFGGVQVFGLLVDTTSRNYGGVVRYTNRIGSHDLLLGLNYGQSAVTGGNYWNDGGQPAFLMQAVEENATSLTAYALDRWHVAERVVFELGFQGVDAMRDVADTDAMSGAVDESKGYFSHVTPRAGVIYTVTNGVDLFASVSGLYEPPTNFQLVDLASGGNHLLDAMHGTVLEVGARGRTDAAGGKRLSWEVSLYHADIRDEILSIDDPTAPGTSLATNIDRTTHAGIEAGFGADLPIGTSGAVLAPRLSVTINDFNFDGDVYYGDNRLPAAPREALRGEVIYKRPNGFYIGPTFDVVGERFGDFANTYRVDSYTLFGLRTGWANDRWSTFAELVNAGDETYVGTVGVRDVAGPDAPILNAGSPRAIYLGVQGRF